MSLSINVTKIIKTGDKVINKKTGIKGVLHLLIEHDGHKVYEKRITDLSHVEFYDGNKTHILTTSEIDVME